MYESQIDENIYIEAYPIVTMFTPANNRMKGILLRIHCIYDERESIDSWIYLIHFTQEGLSICPSTLLLTLNYDAECRKDYLSRGATIDIIYEVHSQYLGTVLYHPSQTQ